MQDLFLSDEIVAELNKKLVGNPLAGAPMGFSASTDIDHLGEEAIFVTLDFPVERKALESDQFRTALEIVRNAVETQAQGMRVYIQLNNAKKVAA